MFNTHTVVQTDNDTNIIVNSRYFPSNGTANDVGGIISANSRKNTVKDTRMEIHNVTCQRYVCSKSIQQTGVHRKTSHQLLYIVDLVLCMGKSNANLFSIFEFNS